MRTAPPVSLCSARAAAAWAGASRISSIVEGSIDENDAPARGTGEPPWPESDKSPVRAPCGRTRSSNSSVTVPRSRSSAACGEEGDMAARRGPAPSADAAAASPRAAGIALPDRSDAAPRARSTATDAPGSPPCASRASWTAAFWAPVSTTYADGPGRADGGPEAPARPTRTEDGGAWEDAGLDETTIAILDGSTDAASTCSSNGTDSTPDPMSRDGPAAAPGASASGPVSSGTTEARLRAIPPYALPDRSVRPAALPSMSISETDARTAAAFCAGVIATSTDCDAAPPPATGIDGPYADTLAPDRRVADGPPPSPPPGTRPTSRTADAFRALAVTYSSNVTMTTPSSRSIIGGAGRAGGASSTSTSIRLASSPANALPDTSRTAPAATVRFTAGGTPVRAPPSRAASCPAPTRTRRSAASRADTTSAPARETVTGAAEALPSSPCGVPDSASPAGSAPAASTYSLNGTVSRPFPTSSDGSVRSMIAGGARSAATASGALDRPANRRPAASEIAPYGRSRRTGPASMCARATAPFCSAVKNMRSVSSSIVRNTTSGPDGGATRAPDSGTRFAPFASSIAAPDRSIPPAGTCSVNIIETMPRPMSRAGSPEPGASAGGTESSTTVRLLPAASPPNGLPVTSAMPLPAPEATDMLSGPADAFAARSESACAPVNASTRRVPSSPSPASARPPTARDGDSAALPFRSLTVTACGPRPLALTNSSNESVSVPVPRLSIGAPASSGPAASRSTEMSSPADRPAAFPDRSCTAPSSAASRIEGAPGPRAAASRVAFCQGASETATVSLTADAARAPSSETRPPAAVTTASEPASRPPGGAATYSS